MDLHRAFGQAQFARDQLVGLASHQAAQHVQLAGRQAAGVGARRRRAVAQVGQRLRGHVGAAAQHQAQRLLQHLGRLALGQEAHRAGGQRGADDGGVVLARGHGHGHTREHQPQPAQAVDTVHAGHVQVQQRQARRGLLQLVHGTGEVGGFDDLGRGLYQQQRALQRIAHHGVVVGNQHFHGGTLFTGQGSAVSTGSGSCRHCSSHARRRAGDTGLVSTVA